MTSQFSAPMHDAVHLIHSHTDSLHTRGHSIHETDEQAHRGLFPYSSLLTAAHPSIYPLRWHWHFERISSVASVASVKAGTTRGTALFLLTYVGRKPSSPRHTSSDRSRTCQNEESNGVAKARAAHAPLDPRTHLHRAT